MWDESVWEKPESQKMQDLGPVRWSQAHRLTHDQPGYYKPAGAFRALSDASIRVSEESKELINKEKRKKREKCAHLFSGKHHHLLTQYLMHLLFIFSLLPQML
jgi:hypothetical protein